MMLFGISCFPSMQTKCFPLEDISPYRYRRPTMNHVLNVFARHGNQGVLVTSSFQKMVDGYLGTGSDRNYFPTNKNIFRSLGSCLIIPPPRGVKVRAIVKFLGGAFIGAIPEVTYSYLIELLSKEGFLVISVPYNVTFDHLQSAKDVYERFNTCLDTILAFGLPDLKASELAHLPLYSVGHSNGALLQALTGSYFSEKIPKANVIVSFNNRRATEAVPYFEQLGLFVSQMKPILEASPMFPLPISASDGWKGLVDLAGAVVSNNDQEAIVTFRRFLDQLPAVLDQVTQGISEFKPTPAENRDLFTKCYNVQRTLLVQFNFDTIDDSNLLEASLRPRVDFLGGTLEKITLDGTHLTPCMQEPRWKAGYVYTPVDAIVQGVNRLLLNDVKVLSRTISRWFGQ
ncbi:hypothetical protein Nepgr_012100 [Nepenthes gracilis]|uniref:Uncharacterized protein n=1 Tax=Nepenthes gracilis TaxID=150966 RepID=A0AAD3XMV2_NEPGR|nr:hypothetical protein Nepgr_012100 [Nepenthes gracilis]